MLGSESGVRSAEPRVAVFIDAENILIAAQAAGMPNPVSEMMYYVRREAAPLGSVVFARAYGDWTQSPCRDHLRECQDRTIEMAMLSSDARGKNTADVQLAVDVMEMVLSSAPPTVIVLASGDRDFIPLVQKVRRYASEVWGIGVRGCVRRELEEACTRFVYLDQLLEPLATSSAPVAMGPTAESKAAEPMTGRVGAAPVERGLVSLAGAFQALRKAVADQIDSGVSALGSRTYELMRTALPGFTYGALGFESFRAFVEAAERAGAVSVIVSEFGVGDMRLVLPRRPSELSVSEPEQACETYRAILLNEKGVPLVKWGMRRAMVEHLWEVLGRIDEGLTIQMMNEELVHYAAEHEYRLPERAILKISHTLNIGRCFESEGRTDYFTDIFETRLRPAMGITAEGALKAMNRVYVNGLRWTHHDLRLDLRGLAMLLFDDEAEAHLQDARALIEAVDGPTSGRGPIGQLLDEQGYPRADKP